MYTSNSKNLHVSTEQVYKNIRKRILLLELEPGQKISENQMCTEYGVSRSVIRSVFARLNQIKLIEVYPQRGSYVSLIDLDYISDLLVLRIAVEKEVIFEIFKEIELTGRRKLVEILEKNLEKQEQYRSSLTYERGFQTLDSEFHRVMIDSVKRYRLVELLDDPMLHIARWRNFDVAFDHRTPALIDEHRAIVQAIKDNDLLKTQNAMAGHLETISDISQRAKAVHPTWFV